MKGNKRKDKTGQHQAGQYQNKTRQDKTRQDQTYAQERLNAKQTELNKEGGKSLPIRRQTESVCTQKQPRLADLGQRLGQVSMCLTCKPGFILSAKNP